MQPISRSFAKAAIASELTAMGALGAYWEAGRRDKHDGVHGPMTTDGKSRDWNLAFGAIGGVFLSMAVAGAAGIAALAGVRHAGTVALTSAAVGAALYGAGTYGDWAYAKANGGSGG